MNSTLRRHLAMLLVCLTLLFSARPAKADSIQNDAIAAVVGIVVVTTAVVLTIVYFARKPPTIRGCASSGPGGLTLINEGDQQTYLLTGDVAGIKPGDRVKVSGKKAKSNPPANRTFIVEKQARDYGACKV